MGCKVSDAWRGVNDGAAACCFAGFYETHRKSRLCLAFVKVAGDEMGWDGTVGWASELPFDLS
jgi:hypothetical protein